jgi:iron complex outermembrane recepter protein
LAVTARNHPPVAPERFTNAVSEEEPPPAAGAAASEKFTVGNGQLHSMNYDRCRAVAQIFRGARAALFGCLIVVLGNVTGSAATATTGSVSGRVENKSSGQYLNNARVILKGSNTVAFTDDTGTYRLANLPPGPVLLHVFYTGLEPQEIALQVTAGSHLEQNVALTVAAGANETTPVKLGAFVVSDKKEMDAEAIAINEQRFSPNLKDVVAAGAFGDIAEGNLGEFMKYLPGVTADFADPTILSVSVRGLNSYLTSVTSDGAQMANANYGGATRTFQFGQVSMNNIARVELTKVPTPSQPADTLGGVINMVSKSAFERKKAQFSYRLYLTANEGNLTLSKQPHSFEEKRDRVLPSMDFTYTLPLNDKFGLVVSGLSSNQFNDMQLAARTYNAAATGTNASFSAPFFQTHTLQDGPRYTHRNSGSLKADWRVTRNSALSVSFQQNTFTNDVGIYQLLLNAGTLGPPTIATGTTLSYGPDFTQGATGRGAISMQGLFYKIRGTTRGGTARYRLDDGTWKIESGVSRSGSSTNFRDTDNGHFYNVITQINNPVRIAFTQIGNEGPGKFEVFNNANQPVNFYDLANHRITQASSSLRDVKDDVKTGDLSVGRQLNGLPVPLSIKLGGAYREQERDSRMRFRVWTFNGPDGNAATIESAAPYAAQVYDHRNSGFGFVNIPWVSPQRSWQAYQQNPVLFSQTPAQVVAEEAFRITNSEAVKEEVSAGFFQTETRLFNNRLNVLTGVRYEQTVGSGQGELYEPTAVWVKNADGSFAHNAAGARIRRTDAGAAGSLEELRLIRRERGLSAQRTFDGFYPSLHLNGNITAKFLARFGYARTYGRPNFSEIIPSATVNELDTDDPAAIGGTISVTNPGLKPWSADNFDLSLEYYTDEGGVFSVGVFRKDVDGFFVTRTKVSTADDLEMLNLDPRYLGWQLTTKFNSGAARLSGIELNFKHSLAPLGSWGRPFSVFVNGSKLDIDANGQGGFAANITESANWGATFAAKRFTLMAKWNYRGRQRQGAIPALGADSYQYDTRRTTLDLNADVRLSARLAMFASVRNVFGVNPVLLRYGSQTPDYAKQFRVNKHGAQYNCGIKGTF